MEKLEAFVKRWDGSEGNERANYQMFFSEMAEALGIEKPRPKGTTDGDRYCFDRDIIIYVDPILIKK